MNTLIGIVGALICMSLTVLFVALVRFKLARIDMTFLEFARRLIRGGGYRNLSVAEFDAMYRRDGQRMQIIDLRETKKVQSKPFPNATSSPFDDFLKDVVVQGKYSQKDPIVLVCDTGHMSRVAANILAEDEGFTEVYSLVGGTEQWERQQRSVSCPVRCCLLARLVHCCR